MAKKRNIVDRLSHSIFRTPKPVVHPAVRSCAIESLESRVFMSVSLVASKANASEIKPTTSGRGVFSFARTGPKTDALQIFFAVSPDSTANAADFASLPASITIPAGKPRASIVINPVVDNFAGNTEVLNLTLTPNAGYEINPKHAQATVRIAVPHAKSTGATVNLVANRPNASETNPGVTGLGEFTVTRTGSTKKTLTVNYTQDGASSATPGTDFTPLSGSVIIKAGQTSAFIDILPVTKTIHEAPRTVILDLASGAYTLGTAQAAVTITDDNPGPVTTPDVQVTVAHNAAESAPTGAGKGQFLVTRVGATTGALTVNYTVSSSSTAVAGTDYTALVGSVVIPAGQNTATIDVVPIANLNTRGNKTVVIALSNTSEANAALKTATLTITDDLTTSTPTWADTSRHFRSSFSVDAGSAARTDKVADTAINFTQLLSTQGQSGPLADNSIRVVEVGADGSVINDSVPFQFDHAANFDAATNASGTLSFVMAGNTAAGATRHYQVYFDDAGAFTPVSVTSQESVNANFTNSSGNASIQIATADATYVLETANGGFSNLIDKNGNDWISYNNTAGSAGTFRGIPNIGIPGVFHPGFQTANVAVVSSGPLKTTVTATTLDGLTSITYEFFPTYVRATVTKASANYWFLYEGTPGGQFNLNDTVTLSDGTSNTLGSEGPTPTSDGNGGAGIAIGSGNSNGEWATFNSASANRYLFMAHDNQDNIVDSYFDLENNMTVFGFGRSRIVGQSGNRLLSGSNTFSFGLADNSGSFAGDSANVNGTYRDLTVTGGATETLSA